MKHYILRGLILFTFFFSTTVFSQEIYFDYDKKSDQYEWYADVRDFNLIEVRWSSSIIYPAVISFDDEYEGKLNKKSGIFEGDDGYEGKSLGKDKSFWIGYMDKYGFDLIDSSNSGGGNTVTQNYATGQIQNVKQATFTSLIFKKKEGLVMNRENAIKKLKEAKDLLELELMTQEEYDKLKKDLTPIIRGN